MSTADDSRDLQMTAMPDGLLQPTGRPCEECGLRVEMPDGSLSDACTDFPNGPWLDCCLAHDWAYRAAEPHGWWKRHRMRWAADVALFRCVWKTGHRCVAVAIFCGVRTCGWWAWHADHKNKGVNV